MREPLTDEYLGAQATGEWRYTGQWTGTSGSLAADVRRLLELDRVKQLLAEAPGGTRRAVTGRTGCSHAIEAGRRVECGVGSSFLWRRLPLARTQRLSRYPRP
jgi:hypothetical protein